MVIGVDEVGRGSLAGPLVVGAVCLKRRIPGLKDSKQLSAIKRQLLAKQIYAQAESAALGWVWPHEIDELGLSLATRLAIKRALVLISGEINEVIIDGHFDFLAGELKVRTIIKADETIATVSAASVIAKVARDGYMHLIAQYFPSYGFETHVGYGTSGHLNNLSVYGPCVLHRLSFRPLAKEVLNGS